jgi:uncharacterized membrane protein YhaH (DUF805 family)
VGFFITQWGSFMDILHALFVPTGRLRGKPYWLGAIVLLLAAILVQYMSYLYVQNSDGMQGMMMASMGSMLLWLLIYPYFCLYGKRLRDVGQPATWFFLVIFLYAIFSWIAQTMVMMPVMMEEMGGMVEQMEGLTEGADEDIAADQFSKLFEAQLDMQKKLLNKTMIPMMIAGAIVTLAFDIVMGVLTPKSDNNPFAAEHDLIH